MSEKKKRLRRSPDDARSLILNAAEASMGTEGPAGLRLMEVARRAGVSHPTILHHFGSREGLVQALVLRSLDSLKTRLFEVMTRSQGESDDGIALTFAAYRDGLAQRILWLLQVPSAPSGGPTVFDQIVQALQETRERNSPPGTQIDITDSRKVVHLIVTAAFGDALIGERIRQTSGGQGLQDFESWFNKLVEDYLRNYRVKRETD